MILPPPTLGDALAAAGLPRDAGAGGTGAANAGGSPWYVRLLVAGLAWAAALSVTGFLAATGMIDEDAFAYWGIAAAAASIVLARRGPSDADARGAVADFVAQLALALSLLARVLVFIGVGAWANGDQAVIGGAMAALEIVLFIAYPDFFQRFLASGLACAWLLVVLGDVDDVLFVAYARDVVTLLAAFGGAWLWIDRPRLLAGRLADYAAPAGYGLAVFVVGALLQETIAAFGRFLPGARWPATAGLAIGVVWLLLWVRGRLGRPIVDAGAGVLIVLVAALAYATRIEPGILAAVGVLLLGFLARDGLLHGLGVAATGATVWHFFYSMNQTMLVKSGILVAGGLVLLGGRWVWLRLAGDPNVGDGR